MAESLKRHFELFQEFLHECYSDNTAESYFRDLRDYHRFLLDYTGREELALEDLNRLSVRSYLASLHRAGKSSATIHRRIESLNCFFDFLRRYEVIDNNPVRGLPRPRLKKGLPPFMGEEELGRLIDQIPVETVVEKRDRVMMELFYGTGLRLSELINLTVNDFEGGTFLRVLGKGEKERLMPLGRRAIEALGDYMSSRPELSKTEPSEILFLNSRGNRLDRRYVQRRVKQLLSSISGDLSPHALRHAFATHMMRRGAELRAIQELLGHENLTATQIYTHLCPQDLKEIYSRTHPRA